MTVSKTSEFGGRSAGWLGVLAVFVKSKKARLGLFALIAMLLVSSLLTVIYSDPQALVAEPLQGPGLLHWFGTNGQGQDVWQLSWVGTTNSLMLAIVTALCMSVVGVFIGIAAGYFGGGIDQFLSFVTNVTLVIPGLPLAIVIGAFLPSGPWTLFFILVITGWAWSARVFRSFAMTLAHKEFVQAARLAGESHLRIVAFEIFPNLLSPFLTALIGSMIYAIAAQVGLEFIGIGDMNRVTWGTNLYWASNDAALLTESWWVFVPTGLLIAISSASLSLLNDALDELTNPALQADRLWRRKFGRQMIFGITPQLRRRA